MSTDHPALWSGAEAATIVAEEGSRLIAACQATPDAAVAACPGWSATNLAVHTTGVHRRVAHWCSIRAEEPERWPDAKPDTPDEPWDWCRAGLDLVVAALAEIGAGEPVWSWTDRRNGGFYHRRMVHETVVHRWDAEASGGVAGAIDPLIAADGIDELIHVGMRFRGDGSPITYPTGSVALRTTDTGNKWRLSANDGVLGVSDHALGDDTTLTGTAEALLLYMWGRGDSIVIDGDRNVASAWGAVAP